MLEDQKAQINIDNKKTHCTFVINQITNVNCSRPCYNNTNFCKTHFIKNKYGETLRNLLDEGLKVEIKQFLFEDHLHFIIKT